MRGTRRAGVGEEGHPTSLSATVRLADSVRPRHAGPMSGLVAWWDRHQLILYLAAIATGVAVGMLVPGASHLHLAITPVLGVLLYATFLAVPFRAVAAAVRDGRFLVAVLGLNFLVVPLVVFVLSRFVADVPAVLVGVLLVLLTPCVDYVIVFAGLAGGARERLLAATPLLMLAQILLLPGYLWLMAGPGILRSFDARPFVDAFLLLIVAPLGLAVLTQLLAGRARAGRVIESTMAAGMVPLMMVTLAVVVASQISAVGAALGQVLLAVPLFIAFVVILVPIGIALGRALRLDAPGIRAVVFSGVTRNSLVVLPIALALPPTFALTPLVVVTQTLIELLAMVTLVALVPRLTRHAGGTRGER